MVRQHCTGPLITVRSVVLWPCWRLAATPTSSRYMINIWHSRKAKNQWPVAIKYFDILNPLRSKLKVFLDFYVLSLLFFFQLNCSVLHPVSEIGDAPVVQLLLKHGANPDLRNQVMEGTYGFGATAFLQKPSPNVFASIHLSIHPSGLPAALTVTSLSQGNIKQRQTGIYICTCC